MRAGVLAFVMCASALPAQAFTVNGVTLGAPLPADISIRDATEFFQGGAFGDDPIMNSIDVVPGVTLAAITDGPDGPVVAILMSHSPRQDGLMGTPDAVATYPLPDSVLTFGETTLGTVLAAYGGLDLDPDDPLATHNPTPSYRIDTDTPAIIQFGFGEAMGLINFTTCEPAFQDGVPECLSAPLNSIYVIDGAYVGTTILDDSGTVIAVDDLPVITDPLRLQ